MSLVGILDLIDHHSLGTHTLSAQSVQGITFRRLRASLPRREARRYSPGRITASPRAPCRRRRMQKRHDRQRTEGRRIRRRIRQLNGPAGKLMKTDQPFVSARGPKSFGEETFIAFESVAQGKDEASVCSSRSMCGCTGRHVTPAPTLAPEARVSSQFTSRRRAASVCRKIASSAVVCKRSAPSPPRLSSASPSPRARRRTRRLNRGATFS